MGSVSRVELFELIRRDRDREDLSIRALAERHGVHRRAVRQALLSPVHTRQLRAGAVVAAVGWQLLQLLGTFLVTRLLTGAPAAYGTFGLVLGLIAWIYLLSLVIVLAAEVNVVAHRHLWPRALLTPSTDRVQLTRADERAYTAYAESERHKGFEVIDVDFEQTADSEQPADSEHRPA